MSEHDQAYEEANISDVVGGGVESVVRLAAHAFDGLEKHDQEIDDLCEAILFRKIERPPSEGSLMKAAGAQNHVLRNLDRVSPMHRKATVSCPSPRYQLDGHECTGEVRNLFILRKVEQDPNGRLKRRQT